MNHSGWFSIHREVWGKLKYKPAEYKVLWLWMISEANFNVCHDLKPGQFYTTMSDMQEALATKRGMCTVLPQTQKIRSYIKDLADNERINAEAVIRNNERYYLIKVLNYTEYQGVKRIEATPETTTKQQKGDLHLLKENKKNNVPDDDLKNPEKFIYNVRVKIPKGLVDHMEEGTMPESYLAWGIKACKKNKVSDNNIQKIFDEWVTWWNGNGGKKQDWYSTWQNRLLQIKWDWIRAEEQRNHNPAWEQSHGGQIDTSKLPPEIGTLPASWKP